MDPNSQAGLTRKILENLRTPDQLNDHPWAKCRFVRDYVQNDNDGLGRQKPGYQLTAAVGDLFSQMIPGAPPKRGKRLDTLWGAYGILAAQYFAPFWFGLPYPSSFRDAWGKIDEAILLFRFGKDRMETLPEEDRGRFKLIGDELEVTPLSTLSDWHKKGIEQLAGAITDREQHLKQTSSNKVGLLANQSGGSDPDDVSPLEKKKVGRKAGRWILAGAALALAAALVFAGVKAYHIKQLVDVMRADLSQLKNLASLPVDPEKMKTAGNLLDKAGQDIHALQTEASPYTRLLGPWLSWVPEYGADLAASADLLDLADQLVASVQTIYHAGYPVYESVQSGGTSLNPKTITPLLAQIQPQLAQARQELDRVREDWNKLSLVKFSAPTQGLLNELDAPLKLLNDGLSAAMALPKLLGASGDGPKTYLVLAQNEDELRPTGGFITAVGTFVVQNGDIFGVEFADSGDQEDWTLPYPAAPWQLRDYMNSPVLVLRDANWFTDFPTSVSWIEYLYAYNHQHSVDGVIAIDQQTLVSLLDAIGPLTVDQSGISITSQNVVSYMREEKKNVIRTATDVIRKPFIDQMAIAIVHKLTSDSEDVDWKKLAGNIVQLLGERHILLQFDDTQISTVLAELGWDGAVRPGDGDFLMLVDSNIGFNKTNAAVSSNLTYDVDLTQPLKPTGSLSVIQANKSQSTRSCIQYGGHDVGDKYPIDYCYWDYMRVYLPAGTRLTDASPHQVPADWMILNQGVPAKVDILDEKIDGVNGFGTLVVVPGGQTYDTRFTFALPARVIANEPGTSKYSYTLKIKKQPGTGAIPATLRVHLPPSAHDISADMKAIIQGSNVMLEANLQKDVVFTVTFSMP
jgi:hypothetical protein